MTVATFRQPPSRTRNTLARADRRAHQHGTACCGQARLQPSEAGQIAEAVGGRTESVSRHPSFGNASKQWRHVPLGLGRAVTDDLPGDGEWQRRRSRRHEIPDCDPLSGQSGRCACATCPILSIGSQDRAPADMSWKVDRRVLCSLGGIGSAGVSVAAWSGDRGATDVSMPANPRRPRTRDAAASRCGRGAWHWCHPRLAPPRDTHRPLAAGP